MTNPASFRVRLVSIIHLLSEHHQRLSEFVHVGRRSRYSCNGQTTVVLRRDNWRWVDSLDKSVQRVSLLELWNAKLTGDMAKDPHHEVDMLAGLMDECRVRMVQLFDMSSELSLRQLFGRLIELMNLPLLAKRKEGVELIELSPCSAEELIPFVVLGGSDARHGMRLLLQQSFRGPDPKIIKDWENK